MQSYPTRTELSSLVDDGLHSSWRLSLFLVIFMVTILACGGGRASNSASGRGEHLPTLTPTPLATLTPTIVAVALAAPPSAETQAINSAVEAGSTPSAQPVVSDSALAPPQPAISSAVEASSPVGTELAAPIENSADPAAPAPAAEVPPVPVNNDPGVTTQPAPPGEVAVPTVPVPPTDTPLPLPTEPPTATPLPTETPTPLPTDTPTATPTPEHQDWVFVGVGLYPAQYDTGLILYGNLTNNTGSPQELISVTGTFYDDQGQVIANPDQTHAYWPGYVIPAGGSLPFELLVSDITNAADFDLTVDAQPTGEIPQQDFEFADVNQENQDNNYCLEGEAQNRGDELDEYLIIAAILYNGQDNVVGFGDYSEFDIDSDDDEVDFEICVNPPTQEITRYELQAWGQ